MLVGGGSPVDVAETHVLIVYHNILHLQFVGYVALHGIAVKRVVAFAHIADREVTLDIGVTPVDVTLALKIKVGARLGQYQADAVAGLARYNVQPSAHSGTIERIKLVFKPFERPRLPLLVGLRLGIGNHLLLRSAVYIDKERAVYLAFAVLIILRRGSKMLALKHLYRYRRLACGMHRELLLHRSAVHPLVAARDVPHAVLAVHQSVQTVAHAVVAPVVLGIYRTVGHTVCRILHGVLRLLGRDHLAVRRYLTVHQVVHISVEECWCKSHAYTRLLQFHRWRRRGAVGDDIDIKPAHAFTHNETLLELKVVGGVGVKHLAHLGRTLHYLGFWRRQGTVLVGRVVEVNAVASHKVAASALVSHRLYASIAAYDGLHQTVVKSCGHATLDHLHIVLCHDR